MTRLVSSFVSNICWYKTFHSGRKVPLIPYNEKTLSILCKEEFKTVSQPPKLCKNGTADSGECIFWIVTCFITFTGKIKCAALLPFCWSVTDTCSQKHFIFKCVLEPTGFLVFFSNPK